MMFISDIWYGAAWSSDLEPGKPMALTIADRPIVLYRTSDGRAVAMEDRCSHRCAPLSKGRVEGDALRCWYHGLLFDSEGKCIEMPGQETVPGFDIHAYPAIERHGCVFVWTGDPLLADPKLIPNSNLTDDDLPFRTGVMHFDADYQLINDNLCDFSHVAYVHENTLGRGNNEWSHRVPTQTNLDDGIRITRWMEGTRIPPTPGVDPELLVDQFTAYDYILPGVLMMQIDSYPLGKAKALNYGPPPACMEDAIYVLRSFQMAVPVIEGKSRYLFGASHPVDPAPGQSLDAVLELLKYVFNEDRSMIEAQQASIHRSPDKLLRNTRHDGGLMRVRRLIARKIREEHIAVEDRIAAE